MYKIISEASIIGIITLLLGKIIMGLLFKKNKNNYHKHPKGLSFAFFSTGFILHFVIELLGLNCWYCDKKCRLNFKK